MSTSSFYRNVCSSDALLRVRSLAGMLGFYRDVLGFRVITSAAGRAELSTTGELPALLVLEEHAEAPNRAAGTPGPGHRCECTICRQHLTAWKTPPLAVPNS